jgi:hypothetical protein
VSRARFAIPVALVALALVVGGAAGTARATGEDEWQVTARVGGANATGSPISPWGLAYGADVEYGVADAWSARLSVGTLAHPVDAVKEDMLPEGTRRAITAIVGATYTVDVLRLVPFVSAGVGLLRWSGPGESGRVTFAMDLGVGADYLLAPRWSVGASAQYLFAPSDLINNAQQFGEFPLAFSLTARVSRIF